MWKIGKVENASEIDHVVRGWYPRTVRRRFPRNIPFFLCSPLVLLLLFPANLVLAEGERKSPFFIDGIHCEGLESLIKERDFRYDLGDEVSDMMFKTLAQDHCEAIFSEFNIKKFQWVTPEDLEKLSYSLRLSQRFKSIDIRIEKSELQNHVHLIGRFGLYEKSNFYKIDLKQSLETDTVDGNRQTTDAEASVEIGRRGTQNPPAKVLHGKYYGTTARRSIQARRLNDIGRSVTLSPDEALAQARHSFSYASLSAQFNQPNDYFLGLGLESSRLSGDERYTIDPRVEVGKFFKIDPMIPTVTRLSLLYSEYSATGLDIYDQKWKNRTRSSMVFAGASQNLATKWIKGKVRFYRALTPDLHYFADIEGIASFHGLFSLSQSLGYSYARVAGAVLPEHRYGLPDRTQTDAFYIVEKSEPIFGHESTLGLRVGYATYQSNSHSKDPYFRSQIYSELSVKTLGENYQTSLALLYGDRRLY